MDISEVALKTPLNGNLKFKIITDTDQDLSFEPYIIKHPGPIAREFENKYIWPVIYDPGSYPEGKYQDVQVLAFFLVIYRQFLPLPNLVAKSIDYVKLAKEIEGKKGLKHTHKKRVDDIQIYHKVKFGYNDKTFLADWKNKEGKHFSSLMSLIKKGEIKYGLDEGKIVRILNRLILDDLPGEVVNKIEENLVKKEYNIYKEALFAETNEFRTKMQEKYKTLTPERKNEIDQGIKDIINTHREEELLKLLILESHWRFLDYLDTVAKFHYKSIKSTLSTQQRVCYRLIHMKDFPKSWFGVRRPFGPYIVYQTVALSNIMDNRDKETLKLFAKVALYPRLDWEGEKKVLKRELMERFIEILRRRDLANFLRGDIASLNKEIKTFRNAKTGDIIEKKKPGITIYKSGRITRTKIDYKRKTQSLNYTIEDKNGKDKKAVETAQTNIIDPLKTLVMQEEDSKLDKLRERLSNVEKKIYDLLKENTEKKSREDIAKTLQSQGIKISRLTVTRTIQKFKKIYNSLP